MSLYQGYFVKIGVDPYGENRWRDNLLRTHTLNGGGGGGGGGGGRGFSFRWPNFFGDKTPRRITPRDVRPAAPPKSERPAESTAKTSQDSNKKTEQNKKLEESREKGKRGEKNAGDIGERHRYEGDSGKNRVSDGSNNSELIEVKNVNKQGLTKQIKDHIKESKTQGKDAKLIIDSRTEKTGPLKAAEDAGDLKIKKMDLNDPCP